MGKEIGDKTNSNLKIEENKDEKVENKAEETNNEIKEVEEKKQEEVENKNEEVEEEKSEEIKNKAEEDEEKKEDKESENDSNTVSSDEEKDKSESEEAVADKNEKKVSKFIAFLQNPVDAVKNVVKNNSWKSGLAFLLLYLFIVGLVSSFQFAEIKLASYDVAINYAKERLENAEENYRVHPTSYYKTQVEVYKETLSEARSEKWKNFVDFDFYVDIAKTFGMAVLASTIRFALLMVILFVVGKVLNGQGKFSQIVAGVGWSANVYYISLIILPLLAQVPYLSSLEGLTGIVGSLFFLLIYFVFQSTFDFDENKSLIWTFVSMLITVFLVNLILYSETWTSSVTNNLLK